MIFICFVFPINLMLVLTQGLFQRPPGSYICLLVFIACVVMFFVLSVVVLLAILKLSQFGVFCLVNRGTPAQETPTRTLKTFLYAIQHGVWRRAFDCLTDTAQKCDFGLSGDSFWQTHMQKAKYHDLDSFRKLWESELLYLTFSRFRIESYTFCDMKTLSEKEPDCNGVVELIMEVTLRRDVGQEEVVYSERKYAVHFNCIKRGDSWFLTNGYFWPSARPF